MKTDRALVGDVLTLRRRTAEVTFDGTYEEIGIRSFGRGVFHKEPISGAQLGAKRVFRIEPGDLLLSNVFAWEGAIAIASNAERGKIGSHRFMTYVPTDGRIDTAWASWYFQSEHGLELIRRASPGSAGRNRTLAIERFAALEIPLPSIDDQRFQVSALDEISRAADMARAALARQTARGLVSALPALVDSIVDRVATTRARVGDLADFISDTVHPGDDPAPAESFVGLQHIESHTGRRFGSDTLEAVKGRKFRFRPGDVLYGYLRPYLNKVWVADRDGLCSVDQYVLRPREGVSPEFLGHCLRGRAVLEQSIELTHSLQLPRLRSGLLSSIEVPCADESQSSSAVSRLDDLRDRIVESAAMRGRQLEIVDALVPSGMNAAFANLARAD